MAQCKTCKAPVRWVRMAKSQKMNLLDPTPVPDGNIYITDRTDDRDVPIADVMSDRRDRDRMRDEEGVQFFFSHFVTCPQREQHRKKERAPQAQEA